MVSFEDKVGSRTWVAYLVELRNDLGKQHLGALFNLIAYYVLALPAGLTLAFNPSLDFGLRGLWIGVQSFVTTNCVADLFARPSLRTVHCRFRGILCSGFQDGLGVGGPKERQKKSRRGTETGCGW